MIEQIDTDSSTDPSDRVPRDSTLQARVALWRETMYSIESLSVEDVSNPWVEGVLEEMAELLISIPDIGNRIMAQVTILTHVGEGLREIHARERIYREATPQERAEIMVSARRMAISRS
jgi:hypothetical protein